MLDRGSTFSHPEVIRLLRKKFIPLAVDVFYTERQKDPAGKFYRHIVNQSPRKEALKKNKTTQGLYTCNGQGKFYEFTNTRSPQHVKRLLLKTLEKHVAKKYPKATLKKTKLDERYNRKPPKGGLVFKVYSQVPEKAYRKINHKFKKIKACSVGRDHMWIRKKEKKAFFRRHQKSWEIPDRLVYRLARFHLIDNTRGEPPMWKKGEVKKAWIHASYADKKLRGGRVLINLDGKFHLETKDGKRGYKARLNGYYVVGKKGLERMDIIVEGQFWGDGKYTPGAPKGKFPLYIAFSLVQGEKVPQVPPQASRYMKGYWEAE